MYAHRNLNRHVWSLTRRGIVVAHVPAVVMEDCELRVRPGGRERVLRQQRKNVHAFIVGEVVDGKGGATAFFEKDAMACTYNPYRTGCFYLKDQPELGVTHAERVLLDANGKMWVGGKITLKKITD